VNDKASINNIVRLISMYRTEYAWQNIFKSEVYVKYLQKLCIF
jgi:hypothetical protein